MTLACQMLSHETLVLIIREEVVASVGTCTCHIAYTSRNLRDPECAWHIIGETFAEDTAAAIVERADGARAIALSSKVGAEAATVDVDYDGLGAALFELSHEPPFSDHSAGMTEARAAGVRLVEQYVLAQTAK